MSSPTTKKENFSSLQLEIRDAIATITLDRPKSLNSLTIDSVIELTQAFIKAEMTEGVRVIIITGAGRAFSSGGDIMEMAKGDGSDHAKHVMATRFATVLTDLTRRMRQCAVPIIAKINGVAAGAGMSIALAADFRIAVEGVKFILAFVNIGLVPDAGAIGLLTQLVGVSKATEWTMLGAEISGEEAQKVGLLYRYVPAQSLDQTTDELAQRLVMLPTTSLAAIKETINIAAWDNLERVYASEIKNQAKMAQTQNFQEGLSAFFENRKPQFNQK